MEELVLLMMTAPSKLSDHYLKKKLKDLEKFFDILVFWK